MTLRDKIPAIGTTSRFTAITMIAVLVIGTAIGVGPVTAQSAQSAEGDGYAVVQGDECISIEALGDGSQSAEEFYDYRTPETDPESYTYSSHGTQHLQADDTSTLFLYEGSDGLSLVVVHDQLEGDSEGGAVTMQFDGLPADGQWVVEDDDYSEDLGEGPFDEFDHAESSSRITWVYSDARSDGAVFTGLGEEFDVTVDPAFNAAADFQLYDGEITDWEVVSATDDGHERTSLDMRQPVRIVSGDCSSIAITSIETDESVTAGESIEVEATVENDGLTADTFTVPITVDGEVVEEHEVTLEPGETTTVSTTVTLEEADTYTVDVANETTTVTAEGDDGDSNDELPGFGIGAALLGALLAVLIARYRG